MGFVLHPTSYVFHFLPILSPISFNFWLSVLEHGSTEHREMAIQHLLSGLLEYAINEQGSKSISKALKEGGKDTLNRIIKRMCEPAKRFVSVLITLRLLVFRVNLVSPALAGPSSSISPCPSLVAS
jgi:hypothetical protein